MLINEITIGDRQRKDLGDLDVLANSIKEFGLIQPIILAQHATSGDVSLVAGGRRLAAVKRLGWLELEHGRDFIWRIELENETKSLRLKAVELEENIRRKDLSWVEQIRAKAELLSLMQSIHGSARMGAPTRSERLGLTTSGFGVNKLAAMLGESNAQTSKDLELASMIEKIPTLAKADTKESARRQVSILGAVHSMYQNASAKQAASASPTKPLLWTLHEGDFRDTSKVVQDGVADLVYTDLPFGVSLSQMSKHDKGVVSYDDSRDSVTESLCKLAAESFRMLHDDRFAVFWFGFNYYGQLLQSLKDVGFNINPVPVVWYKHTRSTENPNTRYANAYDPAIIAMKGSPVFIRPGNTNVVDIPAVAPSAKLQIAQQPVELVERFLLDMTVVGATIVDLCAGSGTTGVASVKNKRNVVLFEREPQACALIKARLGAM
jgi:ParB family chromosome partitioning protein